MLIKSIYLGSLLVVCMLHPLAARTTSSSPADLPDLKIRQYQFVPNNNKGLRVQVANYGKMVSRRCRLELTVRKINGIAVGRTMYGVIPAIQPGQGAWVNLNASGILPVAVSLSDTTFKIIADPSGIVAESDENNNETWHNLS